MLLRLFCLLCCLSLPSFAWTAAQRCPAGQALVCVGLCLCVDEQSPLHRGVQEVAVPGLRDWIIASRQRALAAGTQPIPAALREALAGYFDRALLEQVRYRVGDPNPTSLSHGVLQNPDINAITLIDVVIFQHAHEAEQDVALWAHELLHVQQYLELGVEGFAARYLSDPDSLERPAYALQNEVRLALRRRSRLPAPGP